MKSLRQRAITKANKYLWLHELRKTDAILVERGFIRKQTNTRSQIQGAVNRQVLRNTLRKHGHGTRTPIVNTHGAITGRRTISVGEE